MACSGVFRRTSSGCWTDTEPEKNNCSSRLGKVSEAITQSYTSMVMLEVQVFNS